MSDIAFKAFLTVLVNIYTWCFFDVVIYNTFVWAHFQGHSFPVRNDISHAEQELQWDKKRHWLSRFKWFKLQHKVMTNLKVNYLTIFCKMHWKKVPMIAWELSLFNGCTNTHTSYTQREICKHVLEGKKLIKIEV